MDMKKGLTTKQAYAIFLCSGCRAGDFCELDCVESQTCSFRCSHCRERVWFKGNLQNVPDNPICPYCNNENMHPLGINWVNSLTEWKFGL